MSFYEFIHKFFGDIHGGHVRPPEFEKDNDFGFKKPTGPEWSHNFEENDFKNFSSVFDFKVITDPFEMNRYFEQKVNEMMKSFISPEGFQGFGGKFEGHNVPAITEKQNPRDHFLKPGVKPSVPPSERNEEGQSGSITSWLDGFSSPGPEDKQIQPRTFSSFRSVIRKTVTLPDGTVKTEEIIRNSDGTEQRTESHSNPDGHSTTFFDSPFVDPSFSGLFGMPKVPEIKDPKYQYLKPGYEQLSPFADRVDQDLDKEIQQSGVKSLPPFTKEPEVIQPKPNRHFKSFTRRTVTLPNGVVESEEIIRNPDGTEERTVIHNLPDGTSNTLTASSEDSMIAGQDKKTQTGYDNPALSIALRGVKDFIDILFK